MRCSICGAKLAKDGDICKNCYKEFQEEEELRKDTKEQLIVKRKYLIAYEVFKYIELMILFVFAMIICISSGGIGESLVVIGIFALIFGFLLFLDKRLAVATKVVFYEKKAVYTFNMGPINTTKVVKYDEISDVRYFQNHRQKKFGFGDLCIYTKGIIPGAGFFGGFQIRNIENVQGNLEKIGEILGITIEQ